MKRWITGHEAWESNWTRKHVNATVQAVFNWSTTMRLTRENPFRGISFKDGPTGREMTDAEFQTLLRNSNPAFRRLAMALKLTGARPGELAALRFGDVDFERGIALLTEHKTAKKTGKPRVIVLTGAALKLLRWILARNREADRAAQVLREILKDGPVWTWEVRRLMRERGVADYWTKPHLPRRLGVLRRPVVTKGRTHFKYELASGREPEPPEAERFVFLNHRDGNPWTRFTIHMHFAKLRRIAGFPEGVTIYSLRHKFASEAIRSGVSLKVLATLLGHSNSKMTEKHYIHINGMSDVGLLREAAEQVGKAKPGPREGGAP